jgi:hypothetical protein
MHGSIFDDHCPNCGAIHTGGMRFGPYVYRGTSADAWAELRELAVKIHRDVEGFREVARAMSFGFGRVDVAQRATIVHRDLKPEDVVLGRHVERRPQRARRGKTGRLRRDARARARREW